MTIVLSAFARHYTNQLPCPNSNKKKIPGNVPIIVVGGGAEVAAKTLTGYHDKSVLISDGGVTILSLDAESSEPQVLFDRRLRPPGTDTHLHARGLRRFFCCCRPYKVHALICSGTGTQGPAGTLERTRNFNNENKDLHVQVTDQQIESKVTTCVIVADDPVRAVARGCLLIEGVLDLKVTQPHRVKEELVSTHNYVL